jgi:ABC-type glycerol-3-phosphate transport system permease component
MQWNLVIARTVLVLLPVVPVFFVARKASVQAPP